MSQSAYIELDIQCSLHDESVRIEVYRSEYVSALCGSSWSQSRIILAYCDAIGGVRKKPSWDTFTIIPVGADSRHRQWVHPQIVTTLTLFCTADMFALSSNQLMEPVPTITT